MTEKTTDHPTLRLKEGLKDVIMIAGPISGVI